MNLLALATISGRTELEWYWGYPTCLAAMVAIAAGLLFFFWHRGWFESFSTTKHD